MVHCNSKKGGYRNFNCRQVKREMFVSIQCPRRISVLSRCEHVNINGFEFR